MNNILKQLKPLFSSPPFIKALIFALELSAISLVFYLIALPLYPAVKYEISYDQPVKLENAQDADKVRQLTAEIKSHLPQADYDVSPNRVIITKIGVNAPIVEGQNGDYALSRGAWRLPDSSTPDRGGNTIITGHRFKYLPPSNLTFYLFHKMERGDIISLIWQGRDYYYKIKEIKIVDSHDLSILNPTSKPTLTLFTCDPIYSQKNRLVLIAELIEN